MKLIRFAVLGLVVFLSLSTAATPDEKDKATEARLKKDATFLASPECEGRGPTTEGLKRAGDYIAAEFKKIGLKPGGKNGYFQPFSIAAAVGKLTLTGPQGQSIELRQYTHFKPLGHDQDGAASGEIVFAGYGIQCKEPAYDDYAGLDVKNKIVVLLRDSPRATDPARPKEMARGASLVAKLGLAHKLGAAGVLLVNDADTAGNDDQPIDYTYAPLAPPGGAKRGLAVALRRSLLEAMLPAETSLRDIEKSIDRDLKPRGFALTGWKARLEVERKAGVLPLRNVVGVLDGFGGLSRQTVVVGAHYDHLGYGGPSSNHQGKKRAIHHGADDNASGTAGLLELARRFAAQGPERVGRRIVFIAFAGEEQGLFGSVHYCKEPTFPLESTAAMFNLDMIGRLRKDKESGLDRLLTEGHGTAKEFKELIDNQAKKHGFTLKSQASGFGPSDHSSFCGKKIPVLFFWTGTHDEYHRPTDTVDRLHLDGMRRVLAMSEEIVTYFTRMEKPTFIEVPGAKMGRPSSGPRLGIRPGYGEEDGLLVEGVTAEGAAEKGGMKANDRIVEIAGKPVKNINSYMQAMALQKKGTTIEVVVVRGKEKVKLKVALD